MREKFDFSTSKDQEKFEVLPEKEKKEILAESQEEAFEIQKTLEEDPKKILDEFVAKPLTLDVPNWESRLKRSIKNRLEGSPSRYTHALHMASNNLNDNLEKEKIITAAILYELKNLKEIKDSSGYSKNTVMRFALERNRQSGLLGSSIAQEVEKLSLKDIANALIGKYKTWHGKYDLGLVADIALERLEKEPEAAKKILDQAENKARSPVSYNGSPADLFTYGYPLRVFNYIFKEIVDKSPGYYNWAFKKIYDVLKEENNTWQVAEINNLFKRRPIVKEAYDKFVPEIEAQEIQAKEAAERANETERVRLEQEKLGKKEEEKKRRKEQLMAEIEEKLQIMKTSELIMEIRGDEILEWDASKTAVEFKSLESLYTLRAEEGRSNLMVREIKGFIFKIKDFDAQDREYKDKVKEVESEYQGLLQKIEASSIKFPSAENVIHWIRWYAQEKGEYGDNPAERIKNQIAIVERAQGDLPEIIEREKGDYKRVLREVQEKLVPELAKMRKEYEREQKDYEEEKEEQAKEERVESIKELKKEYLLEQIKNKIEYLRNLYEKESGLDLEKVAGRAGKEGNNIGSVSIYDSGGLGSSISLRMEQKLELRLMMTLELGPESNIELEIGEDLKTILKRAGMVDWVTPHEIGHLVDYALEEKIPDILDENDDRMDSVVENFDLVNQALAKEIISTTFKECIVDGIGFKMIKEYGTSSLAEENQEQRILAALKGFSTTVDVLKNIVETESTDDDLKSIYSVILLRFMIIGEELLSGVTETEAGGKIIDETREKIGQINNLYKNLNKATRFVTKPGRQKVNELFEAAFKIGEGLEFKK